MAESINYLHRHAAGSDAQIDEVLRLLRQDLRNEIGLKGTVENAVVFRFTRTR